MGASIFFSKLPTIVICLHIKDVFWERGRPRPPLPQGVVCLAVPMNDLETDIHLNATISGRTQLKFPKLYRVHLPAGAIHFHVDNRRKVPGVWPRYLLKKRMRLDTAQKPVSSAIRVKGYCVLRSRRSMRSRRTRLISS